MNKKLEIIKEYNKLKDGNAKDIINFAKKYMTDKRYKQKIYNASEQVYTFETADKSGDVHSLIRAIKEFVKSLK